ncbi:hypothetical protein BG003_002055 [Podila horticola]|nr:hypothetical protein BG003_002055 [Podila horticola]
MTGSTTTRIILGTMTFGLETTNTSLTAVRVQGAENIRPFLNTFRGYGHTEIDTARIYGNGETEEALGQTHALNGLKIATKVWPSAPRAHGPENLAPTFRASLKALQVDKVDIFYLHAPDFTTLFEETLKIVDELYHEGLFNKYNPITRDVVRELFPCLKAFGIAFDAYNPLAGGLLSGKHQFENSVVNDGSRYDTKMGFGKIYRERYWNGLFLKAIQNLKTTAESLGFSLVDAALRWMVHHSGLGPNDGIVLGASSVSHLKYNLDILAHGQPLPEEMVKAFDAAWEQVQPACPSYFKTEGVIKTYLPTAPDSSSCF